MISKTVENKSRVLSDTTVNILFCLTYTQQKISAQVGVRVNSVLTRNDCIKCHYRCLKKSFCNNWMHSKLKSKIPLQNCVHLKRLGVTNNQELPIMLPGTENMEYLNNP